MTLQTCVQLEALSRRISACCVKSRGGKRGLAGRKWEGGWPVGVEEEGEGVQTIE